MQKVSIDVEAHSEFCQTSKMELVKLVGAVIFAEFRSLAEFRICLNTPGFSLHLNMPEYARVLNMPQ